MCLQTRPCSCFRFVTRRWKKKRCATRRDRAKILSRRRDLRQLGNGEYTAALRALLPKRGNWERASKSGTREHFLVALTSDSLSQLTFCSLERNIFGTLGEGTQAGRALLWLAVSEERYLIDSLAFSHGWKFVMGICDERKLWLVWNFRKQRSDGQTRGGG